MDQESNGNGTGAKKPAHPGMANLRPWVKGQSGNPKGRSPGLASRVRKATDDGEDLVKFMTDVLHGRVQGSSVRDRIEAAKWLGDRGHGKAVETVVQAQLDATQETGGALGDLVEAELETLARQLKAGPVATPVATVQTVNAPKSAESLENPEK